MKLNFDLKELKRDLKNYSVDSVLHAIKNGYNKDVEEFIDYAIKRSENIIIFDKKRRKLRDDYFLMISSFLNGVARVRIEYVINDIVFTERLFDEISDSLERYELSHDSLDVQIWSHINLIEKKINFVTNSIKKSLKKREKILDIHSSSVTLKDENGEYYQADYAIENLVDSLSKTLSMLAHKNELFINGTLVIPSEVAISTNNEADAWEIAIKAVSWKHLEIASSSCLLFDGEVFHRGEMELFDVERENGAKNIYYFLRDNMFERIDFIANERLLGIINQNHMEGMITSGMMEKVLKVIKEPISIEDDIYLCDDEASSFNYLYSMLGMNVENVNISYGGLTLREWVRCYAFIKHLAYKEKKTRYYSLSKLMEEFSLVGIPNEKLNVFLGFSTFNRKSRDLYDSPFIKICNGSLMLMTEHYQGSNLINIISSVFSSHELIPSAKGLGFEERVLDLFKKTNKNAKAFKFKRGKEEYEYDAVLLMDKRLFIIECKNSSLSYGSPTMSFKKIKFFDDAAKQTHRLVDGLITYPEVIYDNFGVDVAEYELIPVIVNCMPFSWSGLYEGVYITDMSSLSVLFKSKHLTYSIYSKGRIERFPLNDQWSHNEMTSDDFISHLKTPPQLMEYLNATRFSSTWYPINDGTFYCEKRLSTNKDIFSANRINMLGDEDD